MDLHVYRAGGTMDPFALHKDRGVLALYRTLENTSSIQYQRFNTKASTLCDNISRGVNYHEASEAIASSLKS